MISKWSFEDSLQIQKLTEDLGIESGQDPFHRFQIFFALHDGSVDLKVIDSFVDFCLSYERPEDISEPDNWVEFPSQDAEAFLAQLISFNMSYNSEMIEAAEGRRLVQEFLNIMKDPTQQIRFFSNCHWDSELNASNSGYFHLTGATFNVGIVAVTASKIGFFLVEDED